MSAAIAVGAAAASFHAAAQEPTPYITSRERLTILSANDGQSHLRLNARMQRDTENVTRDSITVVHLGPDHPPIVKTVYGTVPNTIGGAPYMAMSGDGRWGFVSSRGGGSSAGEPENLVSVIDLASDELEVVQRIEAPSPAMALMHPDGERLIIPCSSGLRVYRRIDGAWTMVLEHRTDFSLGSIDITRAGDRIVAAGRGGLHVFSYLGDGISYLAEATVAEGVPRFRGSSSQRFTPDGRRALVRIGGGQGTKGVLDDLLVIDMTLDPPTATQFVPQVGDGVESLAIHPSGRFAALGMLEETRIDAHLTYSHLTIIDLVNDPPRLLYQIAIEAIPEGIEFSPDGTQFFVGLTAANHIAVFDVEGMILKKHPMVIRVGHAPASMAIGRRYEREPATRRR
jgi:DNA-binding beta-propeller fold protein YncE